MEMNSYSYGIAIIFFGCTLFIRIANLLRSPVGINISRVLLKRPEPSQVSTVDTQQPKKIVTIFVKPVTVTDMGLDIWQWVTLYVGSQFLGKQRKLGGCILALADISPYIS